jgi:Protein phosphatase 2C
MKHWRYVQAYTRGTSHLIDDLPCQDRALSKIIIGGDGQEVFLGTVADGAGSACRSEYGAGIATRLILKKFEEFFERGGILTALSKTVIEHWITQISDQIGELANEEGLSRREYACTLLVVAVNPTEGLFFQVGDGAIVIRAGENYHPVFWPMTGEYANSTYFITDISSAKQLQFEIINDRPIEDVALMSDGLQGLALQFATKTAHTPFFRPMFTRLIEEGNPGSSEILSAALEKFLDSESVCSRTDDDKTLILSTCRCNLFLPKVLEEELDSYETL